MRKFYHLWCKDKEKEELKLEDWTDICDVTMNENANEMCEKKMTLNDVGK